MYDGFTPSGVPLLFSCIDKEPENQSLPWLLESVMDQLFNSNITSEKNEEKRDKNGKNEPLEEDEFDLAYKMIFTDTLRTRDDQVQRAWSKSSFGS